MNIPRIRELLTALLAELGPDGPEIPTPESNPAPFGINPLTGTPNLPPAFEGCKPFWQAATVLRWPGPRGEPWTQWDYLPGLQPGYLPESQRRVPKYHLPNFMQQFEDDVVWLGTQCQQAREWLARDENAALLNNSEVGRKYSRMFTKGVPGVSPPIDPDFPEGYYVARKDPADHTKGYVRHP